MNLKELAEASGTPERNIRYLISQDVVPAPDGSRKYATYGDEHLKALAVYTAAKDRGVNSLETIKRLIAEAGRGGPVERVVAPGVLLRVDPGAVPDVDALVDAVRTIVEGIHQRRERVEGEVE